MEKVQRGQEIPAKKHENVTVLFADVVDFTSVVNKVDDPEEIVNWLNNLFIMIDALADKYHLEKIKTIGGTDHMDRF